MKDEYTVYLHISPNGKKYYGATKLDVKTRWKNGRGYKNNKFFWKDINKYGWNDIQHIIVARSLTKDEAYWLEIELIKLFDTTNPEYGYNITKGGPSANGLKHTEEVKKRISGANIGKISSMYGKHHSEETKNKIGEANSKSVICLTTKRIFSSASEGAEHYGIKRASNITQCCRGKLKSAGKYNGQKLVWRYLYLETL